MGEHQESSGGGAVLVISACICLLLGAGLGYWFTSSAEPLEEVDREWFLTPEVSIDPDELESSRAEHYDRPLAEHEAFTAYRDAFQAANLLQFAEPTQSELKQMQGLLAIASDDAITEIKGAHNFILVGEPIFEECSKALDGLMTDIVEGRISMERARTGDLPDTYDIYKRNCGSAIPQLLANDLITEDGEWVRPNYGPTIFDILQRYRFAAQVSLRIHPSDSLSPAEFRELTEWRLLVPEAFSPAQRIANLARARQKPPAGIDLDKAEAHIMASAGHWNRARKAYQKVCDGPGATAQDHKACEWLAEHHDTEPDDAADDGRARSPAEINAETKK